MIAEIKDTRLDVLCIDRRPSAHGSGLLAHEVKFMLLYYKCTSPNKGPRSSGGGRLQYEGRLVTAATRNSCQIKSHFCRDRYVISCVFDL